MWARVAGATTYHVQMDDTCDVASFRSCAFDTPEIDTHDSGTPAPSGDALLFRPLTALPVSTMVPVGRRYYWRVRTSVPLHFYDESRDEPCLSGCSASPANGSVDVVGRLEVRP